jgi:hypothetical protein
MSFWRPSHWRNTNPGWGWGGYGGFGGWNNRGWDRGYDDYDYDSDYYWRRPSSYHRSRWSNYDTDNVWGWDGWRGNRWNRWNDWYDDSYFGNSRFGNWGGWRGGRNRWGGSRWGSGWRRNRYLDYDYDYDFYDWPSYSRTWDDNWDDSYYRPYRSRFHNSWRGREPFWGYSKKFDDLHRSRALTAVGWD